MKSLQMVSCLLVAVIGACNALAIAGDLREPQITAELKISNKSFDSQAYAEKMLSHLRSNIGYIPRLHTCDGRLPNPKDTTVQVDLDQSGCIVGMKTLSSSGISFRDEWFRHALWLGAPYDRLPQARATAIVCFGRDYKFSVADVRISDNLQTAQAQMPQGFAEALEQLNQGNPSPLDVYFSLPHENTSSRFILLQNLWNKICHCVDGNNSFLQLLSACKAPLLADKDIENEARIVSYGTWRTWKQIQSDPVFCQSLASLIRSISASGTNADKVVGESTEECLDESAPTYITPKSARTTDKSE